MILKILKIMVSTRSEGTRQVKLAISVHYLVTSIDGEDIPFIKIQIYIYIYIADVSTIKQICNIRLT